MNAQREAFDMHNPACRENIVQRLRGKYGARPYWDRWLANVVLQDTKNRVCSKDQK